MLTSLAQRTLAMCKDAKCQMRTAKPMHSHKSQMGCQSSTFAQWYCTVDALGPKKGEAKRQNRAGPYSDRTAGRVSLGGAKGDAAAETTVCFGVGLRPKGGSMSQLTASRGFVSAVESLAIGGAPTPPLQTCVFRLAQNPVAWSEDLPLGAITECTFDGYAPVTISSWVGPGKDLNGDTVVTPTLVPRFGCTGTVSVNNVQSAYITGPGTMAAWLLGATISPFTPQVGQTIAITPQVGVQGAGSVCEC